jgi:hypothetical protein
MGRLAASAWTAGFRETKDASRVSRLFCAETFVSAEAVDW